MQRGQAAQNRGVYARMEGAARRLVNTGLETFARNHKNLR